MARGPPQSQPLRKDMVVTQVLVRQRCDKASRGKPGGEEQGRRMGRGYADLPQVFQLAYLSP